MGRGQGTSRQIKPQEARSSGWTQEAREAARVRALAMWASLGPEERAARLAPAVEAASVKPRSWTVAQRMEASRRMKRMIALYRAGEADLSEAQVKLLREMGVLEG